MPDVHANLSPSAGERWFACPGSVVLCEGIESRSSVHADEGTRAHDVSERILKGQTVPGDVPVEMLEAIQVYVDEVQELNTPGTTLYIEKRVKASANVWGTADAIVWNPDTKTLYVRDLKYGAGVGVEVSNNLQLKIYALAALLTMKLPAETINVGIVQPRYNHPDGHVRSKDYDVVDLIDFHGDLLDAQEEVERAAHAKGKLEAEVWEEAYLHPTEKGCRWCSASPHCPKLKRQSMELVKQVFTPVTPYDPEALAHTLDMLPIMEAWIENCRKFAYAEAEKGNAIPGYKLVPKTAIRKIRVERLDDLARAIGVAASELYNAPTLKGVTDIQKLAPGKNDKERAAFLEAFVSKESSGHTLVHQSDKREAIRVDAKAAFSQE